MMTDNLLTDEPIRAARNRQHPGRPYRRQDALRRRSADRIVAVLNKYVHPTSALDVGCGTGSFLAALQKTGVADLCGVDSPWFDPVILCIDSALVLARDLELPLDLERKYDLVVSMEVAEHLPPERADGFVADLVRHGDLILFSAAVPFQGGAGHRNERWPSYWADKFKGHGFIPVDLFRPRLWEDTEVLWWLRQNLLLYVSAQRLAANSRLADYHGAGGGQMPLDVVHPVLLARHALKSKQPGG